MAMSAITKDPNGPLSPAQQQEVVAAQDRARKIRKAASVAGFNGWMTGIVAACSAPFALFSLPGFLVTAGLTLVAYNEFRGRQRLLKFDQRAPAFLGWNQVGFLALITFYCLWMLVVGMTGEGPLAAEIQSQPELGAVFGSAGEFDQTYKLLTVVFYGTVIALSAVFQGLNAAYYFTRRKHVKDYLQNTPAWVLDLQHLTSST